jgi:hypothetical protein
VLWPLVTLLMQLTAKLLGGKGTYTTTFRVLGFAYGIYFIGLLAFIPVVGPLATTTASIVSFLGVWMGITQAHQLRGFRTLLLPIIYLVVLTLVTFLVMVLFAGALLSLESLFAALGL